MRLALKLAAFDSRKHFETLRAESLEVLNVICLNPEIISFLTEFSFDTVIKIGAFYYDEPNGIKKQFTWEDEFKYALDADLLLVGSGISGDLVVLDLVDCQAGLLFLDYFWDADEQGLRKFLIKMNCSLGQFFLNSITVKDYPIDAYEAAAYMGSEFTGYWNPEGE